MNALKRKQVYDVLLMTICSSKEYEGIRCENGKIYSSQKYIGFDDADMSDFAIGFYQILYKDILDSNCLLTDQGDLVNDEFAGDTMNSFNTIANITKGAGNSRKSRTPESEWPEYLITYSVQYHCLANFWILPSEVGRSCEGVLNKVNVANDFMDKFLVAIKNKVDFSNDREYYKEFGSWELFVSKHFLVDGYTNENFEVEMYSNNGSEFFVQSAINKMELRAKLISKSSLASDLWDYFNRCGLFD